jgi:kynurenine 3-monooxygenase
LTPPGIAPGPINIAGAGLAGSLMALLLAKRGFHVTAYDRRGDPREAAADSGRSINLALASRGLLALERAGVAERVSPHIIEMRGRMVHALEGAPSFQAYGQSAHEVIYSVSRAALNRTLIAAADEHPNVTFRFRHSARRAHPPLGALFVTDEIAKHSHEVALRPTIAADGAGSAIRHSLVAAGLTSAREDLLDHDYKELSIPARDGGYALDPHALHIWPRGGFMLIALANPGGSFTATLFLPKTGPNSFAQLTSATAVEGFFAHHFPDALALMPDLTAEFMRNAQGIMGTVYCDQWHAAGSVVLLGDAAHAIVPFHGQGMNCALEDCIALDRLVGAHDTWEAVFSAFQAERKPNADAIARMAIENYVEMRASVLDAGFLRRREMALALERDYPGRFVPRYAMVMFHPEISYAEALQRGETQQQILLALDKVEPESQADLARALIDAQLPPLRAR